MNNIVVAKWAVFFTQKKKDRGQFFPFQWAIYFYKKIILKVKNGRKCKKLPAIS